MNFEQLIHVIEAYKWGTISRAAQNCHISIPGLSQSISNLEEELDVKIFKRSRTGLKPTSEGLILIKKAYEVTKKMEEIKEISKSRQEIKGSLNLSASPSLIILLLKSSFAFKRDFPHVKIKITEKTATEVIKAVKQSEIDLGFALINTNLLSEEEEWEYEALLEGKRYVCVNKNSHLAKKDLLEPREILDQPLVVYNGLNQKLFVNDFFNKYGEMQILFESDQIEIIKKTIAEGLAVTFLSNLIIKNDPRVLNGEIKPIPMKNLEKMNSFGWLRLRNTYFSPTAKKFLEYVKFQIKKEDY